MTAPLAGWTDFEWSGLVLRGRDPQGRAWSIGEILRDGGGWVLEIADNTDGNAWSRTRAPTKRAARAAAPIAIRVLGGSWPDEMLAPASLTERCVAYVEAHPGLTGTAIAEALGVGYPAVRSALFRAQNAGVLRSGGRGTRAGWASGTEALLPEDVARILDYLRAHPAATRGAIAAALDLDLERTTRLLVRSEWRGRVVRTTVRGRPVWSATHGQAAPQVPSLATPPAPPATAVPPEPSDSRIMAAARALWRAWTQFVAVVDAAGGIDG